MQFDWECFIVKINIGDLSIHIYTQLEQNIISLTITPTYFSYYKGKWKMKKITVKKNLPQDSCEAASIMIPLERTHTFLMSKM